MMEEKQIMSSETDECTPILDCERQLQCELGTSQTPLYLECKKLLENYLSIKGEYNLPTKKT